jgi:hypothetical protein
MTSHEQVDDFDVGKSVFEKLKDHSPERQQRVLRWVAEGLGLSFSPTGAPPALTGPLPHPHWGHLHLRRRQDREQISRASSPQSPRRATPNSLPR